MINKEHVKLLVEALRSGKYTQTSGALRTDNGYCCLGVGCDIHKKESGDGYWAFVDQIYKYAVGLDAPIGDVLPIPVMQWFGFVDTNPNTKEVVPDDLREKVFGYQLSMQFPTLAQLNDAGYTFDQIADIIERDYLND